MSKTFSSFIRGTIVSLLVLFSLPAFAQEPVYWIIKDGSLNPTYSFVSDTSQYSSKITFDETAPDGSNACKYVVGLVNYPESYFDLKNDPIDLNKARVLCVEYMFPDEVVSSFSELFPYDSADPLLQFFYGSLNSSSPNLSCISGVPATKANIYNTSRTFIYVSPDQARIDSFSFWAFAALHGVDSQGFSAYIKNLSFCSMENAPFYAEDFEVSNYWDQFQYITSRTSYTYHGGHKIVGNDTARVTLYRGYSSVLPYFDSDTVPAYLDEEILHALVVDQPIKISDIEIPEGTKYIVSDAILKDVSKVEPGYYSYYFGQDDLFLDVSDKSFNAFAVFDDSTIVPLFGSDVLSSDWQKHNNVIPVPSGAKKISLEFNYNSIPYFIDNLWLTSLLDSDAPISNVDTIPSDTIPNDTIPSDTIPTDIPFIGDTVPYSFVFDGNSYSSYLYPDGTAFIFEAIGGEEISVPESISYEGNSYSVTQLSIQGNDTLRKLTVPASISFLDAKSIVDCPNLSEVIFASDSRGFSAYAFLNCENLRDFVYSGSLMEWSSADRFVWWTAIDSMNALGMTAEPLDVYVEGIPLANTTFLVLPDGLEVIGNHAFWGCYALENVVFPTSLKVIGSRAFVNSENIKSLVFPCALDSIGQQAFLSAANLDSVVCLGFPPSVNAVDEEYLETFGTYDVPLYVTNIYGFIYKTRDVWKKFDTIIYINATDIELDETSNPVEIVLDDVSATVSWKEVEGATAYVLTIFQNGDTLVVLEFDENGMLEYMFDAKSILRSKTPGFSYTLYGLDDSSNYSYDFVVKGRNDAELFKFEGAFPKSISDEVITLDERSVATPYVYSTDGSIVVVCDSDLVVKVFDSLGNCLYQGYGNSTFPTPNYGFYVVSCGDESFKMIVR